MDSLRKDIEDLNQKILLFAVEDAESHRSKRFLRFNDAVAKRIIDSTADGCKSAIICGVPLIAFQPEIISCLMQAEKTRVMRKFKAEPNPPELLIEINILALQIAQKALLLKPALGKMWFGLSSNEGEIISNITISDLIAFGSRSSSVVLLRAASDPVFWSMVMIGEVIKGPRGIRISQDAALLNVS